MTDEQLAYLIAALGDQTNAINRLADAAEVIAHHLAPDQAKRLYAPNYMRPLKDYAGFDWASIGATVTASDRHGATEVEHNGHVYKRYRSSDDDPKGVDIRFRRVASGTVDEKNMVWATLIKFADKKREPARPLRGELAEAIEHAAKPAQSPAPVLASSSSAPSTSNAPAAPGAPGDKMTQATAVATAPPATVAPSEPATPASPPTQQTSNQRETEREREADLFQQWQQAHNAAKASGHPIPEHYQLEPRDNAAILQNKINGLRRIAAGELFDEPGVKPPVQHTPTDPNAHRGDIKPMDAIEIARTKINDDAARYGRAAKPMQATVKQIGDVKLVLLKHAEDADNVRRVVRELCGKENASATQVLALHAWLKPANGTGGLYASNPDARNVIKAILAAHDPSEGHTPSAQLPAPAQAAVATPAQAPVAPLPQPT